MFKECVHCGNTNKPRSALACERPADPPASASSLAIGVLEELCPTLSGLEKGSEELGIGHVSATRQEEEFEPDLEEV